MTLVTMLYIVALGAVYWYRYDVVTYPEPFVTQEGDIYVENVCKVKTITTEGLFQFKTEILKDCRTNNTERLYYENDNDDYTELKDYKDFCNAKSKDSWCQYNNTVISMMVLAIISAFIAAAASCVAAAKPYSLCTTFFAFAFGLIAMAVYAASDVGRDGDSDVYGVRAQLGDRMGLKHRAFHFSFAFTIVGWICSLIAFGLLMGTDKEIKIVAPVLMS